MGTNVTGEKVGEIFAEIGVKFDKLDADFKKVENQGKKTAEKIEGQFSGAKFHVNTRPIEKSFANLERQSVRTSTIVSNALAAVFTGAVLYKITNFFIKSIDAYKKSEDAQAELVQQLGYTSVALNEQAAALQKVTKFADEDITSAQARIAAFTKDENQIKLLTKATLDFAAAKKVDLTTAGDLLSKTIGGEMNALGRYGVKVDGAAGSTKRLMQVVEGVASLYGGMAEAQGQTFSGRLEILKNKVDDLEEGIGGALVPTLEIVAGTFGEVADSTKKTEGFFKGVAVAGRILGSVFIVVKTSLVHIGTLLGTVGASLYALSTLQFKLLPGIIKGGFNAVKDNSKNLIDEIGKMWTGLDEKINTGSNKIGGKKNRALGLSDEDKKAFEKRLKETLDAERKYLQARDALMNDSIKDDAERDRQAIQDKLKMEIAAIRDRIKTEKLDKVAAEKEIAAASLVAQANLNLLLREQRKRELEINMITSPELRGKSPEQLKAEIEGGTHVRNPRKETKDETEAATRANEEFAQSMASAFSQGLSSANNLGDAFANMSIRFGEMILQALFFKAIMAGLNAIPGVGSALSWLSIGAHSGGEFVGTSSGVMKMAGGGSFIVPGGYPNDSFPLMVETGERVTVTPANRVGSGGDSSGVIAALARVETKIGALTRTVVNKEFNANIFNPIDGTVLVKQVVSPNQNNLIKAGVALEKL